MLTKTSCKTWNSSKWSLSVLVSPWWWEATKATSYFPKSLGFKSIWYAAVQICCQRLGCNIEVNVSASQWENKSQCCHGNMRRRPYEVFLTRHGGCVESKVSQILPSKKWGNQREDVIHNNNIIIINTARRELTHQPLLKHFLKSLVIVKSMRNSSVLTPKPYSINKPYHRILIWFWQ